MLMRGAESAIAIRRCCVLARAEHLATVVASRFNSEGLIRCRNRLRAMAWCFGLAGNHVVGTVLSVISVQWRPQSFCR